LAGGDELNAALPSKTDLPKAKIRQQSQYTFVWIVPLIAAIVAGWLILEVVRQTGPLISIQFNDGNEIKANQTILRYRGVQVGNVRSIQLSKDAKHVEVQVRLDRSAENLARDGALFWIVRPQVGAGGLHGLETIVSGPYIQVQPGAGKTQKKFIGVEKPPIMNTPEDGLEIIVTAPQLGALNIGSPVYYRGLEVGAVRYFELGQDSTMVNIHILIETNFAPLVRTDSKFWNAGGIDVDLKLFGINISAESFKALVIGGIAFATPPSPGILASNGSVFPLNKKVDDKWLQWSPSIEITNTGSATPQGSPSSLLLNSVDSNSKE
jgi:paraquat-inducible protein B